MSAALKPPFPAGGIIRYCPHCRQPWPVPDTCECDHGKTVHNLSKDGKQRTECSVFTVEGPCGCTEYTPAEVPSGT
jgi:hypothetical protein